MPFYMKAQDEVDSTKYYLLSAKIYNDLGEISMKQLDYPLARTKFKQAILYFKKAGHPLYAFCATLVVGRT
jgi:hypothetical protein